MKNRNIDRQFAVLGLGAFGESIARTLTQRGYHVLAFDKDPDLVHDAMEYATYAVQGDLTDEADMDALGISNFEIVVIAVGRDFESALLGSMIAKEFGAQYIIAKATGYRQKRILESIGVDRVVLPEIEMGQRIASTLIDRDFLDYIDISEEYSIAEIHPPAHWIGQTIGKSAVREETHLNIIAIKHKNKLSVSPKADYIIDKEDVLVVLGSNEAIATYQQA